MPNYTYVKMVVVTLIRSRLKFILKPVIGFSWNYQFLWFEFRQAAAFDVPTLGGKIIQGEGQGLLYRIGEINFTKKNKLL